MVYTVVLKKVFNNRVNDGIANNPSVSAFFSKYPFLMNWFSAKLMGNQWIRWCNLVVLSIGEGTITTAGLHPILFAFIVLASRLSGSQQQIESFFTVLF